MNISTQKITHTQNQVCQSMTQHKYHNMLFKLQLKHCQSVNGNNTLNERVTQKLSTLACLCPQMINFIVIKSQQQEKPLLTQYVQRQLSPNNTMAVQQ